jgi:hypothetical protein
MEFGRAFSYQFRDPDWLKKLIIPGLVTLIPLVGQFFIMGWMLETTRRVIYREMDLLPELDFGANIGKGFKAFLITLAYTIPIFVIMLPFILISSLGTTLDLDESTMSTVVMVFSVCCGGLAIIYGIVVGFVMPAALGNFVVKGQASAAFKFKEIIALVKAAPVAYLLTLVGGWIAGFIASLGSVACGLGVLLTMPYSMSMMGHLYGQAYLEATKQK